MDILLSTDINYIMPTGVLMHSISTNNKDIAYHVLVNENFTSEDERPLSNIARHYDCSIHFYRLNHALTEILPFGLSYQAHHVSIETYFRLFITELLPSNIKKVLYLDGDMIVRKSLHELWDTDLNDVPVACVHDMDESVHVSSGRLHYNMSCGYFNAGMLLINLDYWRKNNILNTFLDFIKKNHELIRLHDQDVLNSVFGEKCKWVSTTYNFQSGFVYSKQFMTDHSNISDDIEQAKKDPIIVHFCAPEKPWMLECFNPYCPEWRYYWRKSEWRNSPLKGEKHDTIKNRIRTFLLRHNLYTPPNGYQKIKLKNN